MPGATPRFRRSQRLLTPADFRAVFSTGRRLGNRSFGLIVKPNDVGHARLGLAISKKIDKRAVARNRIKRVVRAWFAQTDLPAIDVVVLGRGGVSRQTKPQLWASLRHLEKSLKP
ncbi:ribonuclease P protein component [bacterium]|nr:ribonuclease P protein component [bacterium]